MNLSDLIWYFIILGFFSIPMAIFLYFILKIFSERFIKLAPLARLFAASFKSTSPSLESYGYRVTHRRSNERLFILYLNGWQRHKFRLLMLLVVFGGVIRMYLIQIKALSWIVYLMHKNDLKLKKKKKKIIKLNEILQDIIVMLQSNEIDKAQRKLKTTLENGNFIKYHPCDLLFIYLCDQMLQEIESGERIFRIDPKEDQLEKQIICNALINIFNNFLLGKKNLIYDEILKKEFAYQNKYE